jgi:hypothetical protein
LEQRGSPTFEALQLVPTNSTVRRPTKPFGDRPASGGTHQFDRSATIRPFGDVKSLEVAEQFVLLDARAGNILAHIWRMIPAPRSEPISRVVHEG